MSFDVKISTTLSSDKTYITIADNGTNWGAPNPVQGDITAITVSVLGRNDIVATYNIALTSTEITDFTTGAGVTLYFTDSRWFGTTYAPDDFYTVYLTLNSTYVSDYGYFSLILDISKLVHDSTLSVSISPSGLIESQTICGMNLALDTLTRLDSSTDPSRGYKWGILYDYTYANITKYF
jgi:hypothetical protein